MSRQQLSLALGRLVTLEVRAILMAHEPNPRAAFQNSNFARSLLDAADMLSVVARETRGLHETHLFWLALEECAGLFVVHDWVRREDYEALCTSLDAAHVRGVVAREAFSLSRLPEQNIN